MRNNYSESCPQEEHLSEKNLKNVVVIGGGTGQPIVLRALNLLGVHPSAIVTMADDGGSSGRLRQEMGIIPPGDVRNCLAALASSDKQAEAALLGYRFSSGEGLAGHALGNLIIAAFTDITGSFEQSVKLVEQLLKVQGRVLPSTLEDVVLSGCDREGTPIQGQKELAHNEVAIAHVLLSPQNPSPNPEAIEAIAKADLIVLAPGSLFTSLIPNLLVGRVSEEIGRSSARVIYIANVRNMRGETTGMNPYDYVHALHQHGLANRIDTVLLNRRDNGARGIELAERIRGLGVEPYYYDLVDEDNELHHDVAKLSQALKDFL